MIEVVRVDYVGNKPIVHLYSDDVNDVLPTDKIGILEINHGAQCIQKYDEYVGTATKIFSGSKKEWLPL